MYLFISKKIYTFNIINLIKPDSLYNNGMKPLFYSEKQAKKDSISLFSILKQVIFSKISAGIEMHLTFAIIKQIQGGKRLDFFTPLHFKLNLNVLDPYIIHILLITFLFFIDDYDCIYLAHCYPYTYTQLQNFLTIKIG